MSYYRPRRRRSRRRSRRPARWSHLNPKKLSLKEAYKILGLKKGASRKQIKEAYHSLVFEYHPDRNPDDPEAPARIIQLTDARDKVMEKFTDPEGSDEETGPEEEPIEAPPGIRRASGKGLTFTDPTDQLVLAGRKSLTTRSANTLRIGAGTQVYQTLLGTVVFVRFAGEHTFLDTLARYGGLSGYLRAEGMVLPSASQKFPSGTDTDPTPADLEWAVDEKFQRAIEAFGPWVEEWIRGERKAALYDLALDPFPSGEQPLYPCPPDSQLYVLPILPTLLKRYVRSSLLWLSEQAAVRRTIEQAPSMEEALEALQSFQFQGGQEIRLTHPEAAALIWLTLERVSEDLPWEEQRGKHAALGGRTPPSFGFYEKYLGKIGTVESFISGFGGRPSLIRGARSLSALSRQYDKSLHSAEVLPTFFTAPVRKNGKPVVLVVTGSINSATGMELMPLEYHRDPEKDLIPVLEAMISEGPAPLLRVCFLLPPPVVVGKGKNEKDIVRGESYQRRVSGYTERQGRVERTTSLLSSVHLARLARRLAASTDLAPEVQDRLTQVITWRAEDERKIEAARQASLRAAKSGQPFKMPPLYPGRPRGRGLGQEKHTPKDAEWLKKPKGEDWFFADVQPQVKKGKEFFFGDFPYVQAWPSLYSELIIKWMKGDITRSGAERKIKKKGLDIDTFRSLARDAELGSMDKAFSVPMEKIHLEHGIGRSDEDEEDRIFMEDLPWTEKATVLFGEDMRTGEFAPLRGSVMMREEVYPKGRVATFGLPGHGKPAWHSLVSNLYRKYMAVWAPPPDPSSMSEDDLEAKYKAMSAVLDPVETTVILIHAGRAMQELQAAAKRGETYGVGKKVVTPAILQGFFKKQNMVALKDGWYLGIGAAKAKYHVPLQMGGHVVMDTRTSATPFVGNRKVVKGLASRLLRIEPMWAHVEGGRRPFLSFVSPSASDMDKTPPRPWDTSGRQYPLKWAPAWDKDSGPDGRFVPIPYERRADYLKAVTKAFRGRKRPDAVTWGRLAGAEGREKFGKRTKRGQRQQKGFVPEKGEFATFGFFKLVSESLDAKKTKYHEQLIDRFGLLESLMVVHWDLLLEEIQEFFGSDVYPDTTPPPVGPNADPKLEIRVLKLLQGHLDKPHRSPLFVEMPEMVLEQEMYLPRSMRPGASVPVSYEDELLGEVTEGTQFEDFFSEEVQDEIKAIKNPRRRKPRKPRKARARRGRPRANPMDDKTWQKVKQYLTKGHPPDRDEEGNLVPLDLTRPVDDAEMLRAIESLFPTRDAKTKRAVPGTKLTPIEVFSRMVGAKATAFPSLEEPDYHEGRDVALLAAFKEDHLDADNLDYLAARSDLSLKEGENIVKRRLASKKRGRIVSPSGALCSQYRNVPKLKGYDTDPRAPKFLTMGREAWIWVGPPFPIHDGTQTSKTRVMTYRQGTHIDCDEAVGPAEPFSRALAHAVQGMVLWLAEKPARMERINRICIGQVGGSAYRVLWTPGPERRLDAQDMLRRAYGGNAMNLPKSYSPQADTDAYIQALELEKRRSRARSLIGFEGWDREEEAEPAAPTSGGAAEDFKVKMGAPVPVKPRATGVKTTLKAASDEDEDGWNVDDVFGE